MLTALKSEFRKFLTVRSTYIVTGLIIAAVAFFSIYVFGYQFGIATPDNPRYLYDVIYNVIGIFVTFSAILAILLVTHEYRYNTINYTLTSSRSRVKVLLSKAIVVLTYATAVGIVVAMLGYFGSKLGVSLAGKTLVGQDLNFIETLWRLGAYTWGYTLMGMIIGVLVRGVVGSIVLFFIIPTVEQVLSLLLKGNTKYLPFRSLDAIPSTGQYGVMDYSMLSNKAALGVFSLYLLVLCVIATVLFVRRDAS